MENENEDKETLGTSTEALINSDFSLSVRKEKSVEILTRMMKSISEGNPNITPFVIASVEGNLIVEECIVNDDGTIQLPELKVNTQDELKAKSKFVRKILKEISPILKAEIENVTYVALMRKDSNKLKKMMKELKNPKTSKTPVKLENRAGCIWLIVGDEEFVL